MSSYIVPAGQSVYSALQKYDNVMLLRGAQYVGNFAIPRSNVTLTATGDSSLPMPIINGGIKDTTGKTNIAIDGIKFDGANQITFGIRFLNCTNIRVNGVKIVNFGYNGINCEGYGGVRPKNFSLTNSYIANNWPRDGSKHCEGMYCSYTDGLVLTGNVFHLNGGKPGTETIFNHNVYLHANCGSAKVEGNLFSQASSHGIQQRCGGDSRYNLFLDNAVHMSYGLVNGSAVHVGGVTGTVEKNVYIGGKSINGAARGWCLELSQIAPSPSGVTVQTLLMAQDNQNFSTALHVASCQNIDNPSAIIDPSKWHLNMKDIYVWDWPKGAYNISAGKPTMTNVGVKPPTQANLRTVIGTDPVTICKNDPTQIKALVLKCFAAAGVPQI